MNKIIDFYVPIIDNYGDIGFALNLVLIMTLNNKELTVRFFSDDEKLFYKMIGYDFGKDSEGQQGKTKKIFPNSMEGQISYYNLKNLQNFTPSKNIFTFFDYRLPKNYLQKGEIGKKIIQFGYFLLHKGVENLHLTTYEIDGNKITHFIPSLIKNTGGILINSQFINLDKESTSRLDFLKYINSKYNLSIPEKIIEKKWISVFVYKDTLTEIIDVFKHRENEVFFVFDGLLNYNNEGHIITMPFLELLDYNKFLSICDVNIVRGENSLCTSLSFGKPTLWDIYKEKNNAHKEKIEDFINFLLTFEKFSLVFKEIINTFNGTEKNKSLNNFLDNFDTNLNLFKNLGINIDNECNLYTNLNKILCE